MELQLVVLEINIGFIRLHSASSGRVDLRHTESTFNVEQYFPAENGIIQLKPTNLYNNSTGTTGTVTLSQSAANFTYLEIFYKDSTTTHNRGAYHYVRVYNPNGKYADLIIFSPVASSSSQLRYSLQTVLISGRSITRTDYLAGFITNNTVNYYTTSEITIVRVNGYK